MNSSSSRVKTLPVGLLGELRMMALVRGVKARRNSSRVEGPVRRVQVNVSRSAPQSSVSGPVILIERLEENHFIARIEHREHGRDHAFGGAAADRDFALGVEVHRVVARVLGRDGVAERLGAPGDGVLVDIGVDSCRGGAFERFGRGEIGKALGEIGGAVADGQARHLADYGFGEIGDALAAKARAKSGGGGRHS